MLKLQIIGNLGSDAEIRQDNGVKFVKLSIAHTERRRLQDGTSSEITTWVSATINGDGGNVVQYLKKGVRVYAYGDVSLRVYHSEKQRTMVAGLNLFIRNIELLGGSTDDIPKKLYDENGMVYPVTRYYWVDGFKKGRLFDQSSKAYNVDVNGWVSVTERLDDANNEVQSNSNDAAPF